MHVAGNINRMHHDQPFGNKKDTLPKKNTINRLRDNVQWYLPTNN